MEANITRIVKLEPWESTEYQQLEKYDFLSLKANHIILDILSFPFVERFFKEVSEL